MQTEKRYIRRAGAAEKTGLSMRMIDKLIRNGELPCSKIGAAVVIDVDDVDAFVASRKQTR